MTTHLLSFATSNWKNAHLRLNKQIAWLQKNFNFFKTSNILDESSLNDDYLQIFSKYLTDYGYGMWSWKPYLILNQLKKINDNDFLLYLDGGCSLNSNNLTIKFLEHINNIENEMQITNKGLAIGYNKFSKAMKLNVIVQVHKHTLEKFNLIDNFDFLLNFNHYEAGMLLIRKTQNMQNLIKEWYQFFIDNYEYCFYNNRTNRTDQYPQYIFNGADQSVLQCLLTNFYNQL